MQLIKNMFLKNKAYLIEVLKIIVHKNKSNFGSTRNSLLKPDPKVLKKYSHKKTWKMNIQ